MKILIGYDGSDCSDAALDDLRTVGLPEKGAEAIAVAASFGIPFVVSTPPNDMIYGEGGVRFNDLFLPGIIIMLAGCLIISLTGRWILNLVGIF